MHEKDVGFVLTSELLYYFEFILIIQINSLNLANTYCIKINVSELDC